ncbi:MAG TPA: carboxypeptidase-like regulatory domain-containing protein, partial [Niastella sp.]|nr:carboxypeptidase-like regulatory domain-containing protein [Niastella sp.]
MVKGRVTDDGDFPLEAVSVVDKATGKRTSTNTRGEFSLEVSCKGTYVEIVHPAYTSKEIKVKEFDGTKDLGVFKLGDKTLDTVDIRGSNEGTIGKVPKIELRSLPTITGNIEDIIKSYGLGVRSNNEMSATYNVRGGSFEENLIYVNDIEIYRPFLVRAGQQEGLSFINPDMVQDIFFSSGGFEARYDDRLSSVLSVKYRRPTEFRGSVSG